VTMEVDAVVTTQPTYDMWWQDEPRQGVMPLSVANFQHDDAIFAVIQVRLQKLTLSCGT
jgi:hypothetical protein